MTVDITREAIETARHPEDLFGHDAPERVVLRSMYRQASFIAHPDRGGSDDLMAKLTRLYEQGLKLINAKAWGKSANVGARIAKGDICNLYLTADGDLLKVPRSPGRSNLVLNEAKTLKKLRNPDFERYWPYVPELKRSYRSKDPTTSKTRQVNVLSYIPGFYTLAQVRDAYPDGIGGRDMAWMWRRILVAIGYVHKCGVIHGAITPEHILIHPTMHGVILIDWTLAGVEGDRRTFKLPRWESIYPDGDTLTRESDIYMATESMAYVLHPEHTPQPIHTFLRGCRLKSLPSAWRLKSEFDDLLHEIYGPRRYRPFVMPATA